MLAAPTKILPSGITGAAAWRALAVRPRGPRGAVGLALLSLCVVAAGCVSTDGDGGDDGDEGVLGLYEPAGVADTDADYVFEASACDSPSVRYALDHVADGDTVVLQDGGGELRVRFLGIDTPELSSQDCFGSEARSYITARIEGEELCILRDDASDDEDTYGRKLRYVYMRDASGRWYQLNARLIRLGIARVFEVFVGGLKHEQDLRAMQAAAEADGLGGWTDCGW